MEAHTHTILTVGERETINWCLLDKIEELRDTLLNDVTLTKKEEKEIKKDLVRVVKLRERLLLE